MTTKFLFISDNPTGNTGLGRVAKAIADRVRDTLPQFEVGFAGLRGHATRHSPYPIYPMLADDPSALSDAWEDFAGDEPGVIFAIMNAVWLPWMKEPRVLAPGKLKDGLLSGKIKKWGYVPVDAESAGSFLPKDEVDILRSMDRVLAYTKFGADLIQKSLSQGNKHPERYKVPHLPHGTDASIFYPRSRDEARNKQFCEHILKYKGSLSPDTMLIGCVATNTARKDWPLAFETCAELKNRGIDVGLWAHSHQAVCHWDLPYMAEAFGVKDCVQFTFSGLSDDDMAWGYSACDVMLGIGSGEGWGMPISESLACGIPTITGDYAGVTEFVPSQMRVAPKAWRWDGHFCNKRPVFDAKDWADCVQMYSGQRACWLDARFYWDNCWTAWHSWFLEGLR